MAAYQVEDQSAQLHLVVNPLVNWIWMGFGVLAFGTGIALLPERAFSYALAKLPAEVATATPAVLLLGALLLGLGAPLAAQEQAPHSSLAQTVLVVPQSDLERDLQKSIICMCGTCGRQSLTECTCGKAAEMRQEISDLVAQGKTRDEVIQYYIAKYGSQEPLAAPIDKGFNRLAWLVPYVLGAGGLVMAGFVAIRWSRKTPDALAGESVSTASDPALEARLDDELDELDG
jgi:cytochrome c-type biogenesis protein CcmH/NrfF